MMKLRRRIKALETEVSIARNHRKEIVRTALNAIPSEYIEPFFAAFYRQPAGFPLSAAESAAQQAFKLEVTKQFGWFGYSVEGYESLLDRVDVVSLVLRHVLPPPYLELACQADDARRAGLDPTPEEAAAHKMYIRECQRLSALAQRGLPAGTVEENPTTPPDSATESDEALPAAEEGLQGGTHPADSGDTQIPVQPALPHTQEEKHVVPRSSHKFVGWEEHARQLDSSRSTDPAPPPHDPSAMNAKPSIPEAGTRPVESGNDPALASAKPPDPQPKARDAHGPASWLSHKSGWMS